MTTATALMLIDRDRSTVTIAGRRFPAVGLICPVSDEYPLDERHRALGPGGGDGSVYIPAENGVLFRVEEPAGDYGLQLDIDARTCELERHYDEALWLPWNVGLVDGDLVPDRFTHWYRAEPDWVVETILRLSVKPFTQPDGPACQLVRLNHFDTEEAHT